jgi:hypothetical protein
LLRRGVGWASLHVHVWLHACNCLPLLSLPRVMGSYLFPRGDPGAKPTRVSRIATPVLPFASLASSLHSLLEAPPTLGTCHLVLDAASLLDKLVQGSAPGPLPRAAGGMSLANAHVLAAASRGLVCLGDREWDVLVRPLSDALVNLCARLCVGGAITIHLVFSGKLNDTTSSDASSTRDTLRARQRRGHVLASELRHGKGKLRRKQGRRCYGVWGFSQPKVCVTCAVVWCHHDLLQPLPAFSHPSWRHIRTWYGPWGGWSGSQQRTPQAAWLFKMPRPGPPCMDS